MCQAMCMLQVLIGSNQSCLEIYLKIVVWTFHTFENNFGIKH